MAFNNVSHVESSGTHIGVQYADLSIASLPHRRVCHLTICLFLFQGSERVPGESGSCEATGRLQYQECPGTGSEGTPFLSILYSCILKIIHLIYRHTLKIYQVPTSMQVVDSCCLLYDNILPTIFS